MLKSTLCSLPIYFLFSFIIPKSVAKKLEEIQRDFLWEGGSIGKKKLHLVNSLAIFKDFFFFFLKRILVVKIYPPSTKLLSVNGGGNSPQKRDMLWRKLISENFGKELGGWCS